MYSSLPYLKLLESIIIEFSKKKIYKFKLPHIKGAKVAWIKIISKFTKLRIFALATS